MHGALWQFPHPAVAPSISFTKGSSPSKTRYIDSIAAMRYNIVRDLDEESEDFVSCSSFSRYNSLDSDTSKEEFFEEVFSPLYIQLGGVKATEAIVTSLFNKLQTDSVLGQVFEDKSKVQILRERRAFLQRIMGIPERSESFARVRNFTFLLKNEKLNMNLSYEVVKEGLLVVLDEFLVHPALIYRIDMILSVMKSDIIAQVV